MALTDLSPADQLSLLRLARQTMDAAVRGLSFDLHGWGARFPAATLRQPAAAFVTLYHGSRLRGCVGSLQPGKLLYLSVADAAIAAALHDPRFHPVTADELAGLKLEVSVLSPFFVIEPEKIVPGEHGLMITHGFSRGLLLPKVATEQGWARERFLEETCLKAGLPPDAWQSGAQIEAFTAVVFAEHETVVPEPKT